MATVGHDYVADAMLVGPPGAIAAGIAAHLSPRPRSGMVQRLTGERFAMIEEILERLAPYEDPGYINPLDFLLQLNPHLNDRHTLAVDTGSHTIWAALFLRLTARRPWLVSSRLGTMGLTLPA